MEKLIKCRGSVKGQLTKLEAVIKELKENATPPKKEDLKCRLEALEKIISKFESHQDEIDSMETAIEETEQEERFVFSERAIILKMYLREELQRLEAVVPVQVASDSGARAQVRLPKLELPVFDGNIFEWASFYDVFLTTVHNNPVLSGAQKLQYLKASLRGEASSVLHNMNVTNDNYAQSLELLLNRYQNLKKLKSAQIQRLLDYPVITLECPLALEKLSDTIKECLRALENMKVPVDKWDEILLCILSKKLDSETRRQWELDSSEDSSTTMKIFLAFMDKRSKALSAVIDQPSKSKGQWPLRGVGYKDKQVSVHYVNTGRCKVCEVDSHPVYKCALFQQASVSDRTNLVRNHRLCYNCLSTEHIVRQCRSKNSCQECNSQHHTLLHRLRNQSDTTDQNPSDATTVTTVGNVTSLQQRTTLLSTAIVYIEDSKGRPLRCRALLDSGSQTNLMTVEFFQRLGLAADPSEISVTGVGSIGVGHTHGSVHCRISSQGRNPFVVNTSALVLPTVTGLLPVFPCEPAVWSHVKGLRLADPLFNVPDRIDILLGASVVAEVLETGLRKGATGTPMAQASKLGWLLFGKVPLLTAFTTIGKESHEGKLEEQLQRFWQIEEVPESKRLTSVEQDSCQTYFATTHTRDNRGRYVVSLPFRESSVPLGNSRIRAVQRWHRMERKLKSEPDTNQQYTAFMKEYLHLGHMEPIGEENPLPLDENSYYLPHHAVLREASSTTKLRVVFDASANTPSGSSLNSKLMVGPQLQDELITLLLRFRTHLIALSADIAKMYRQVKVTRPDTDFQRIVWRENPTLPLQDYRLLTVTYGTACAPYLATKCLEQLANDEGSAFPVAAEVTKKDFYMDDLLSGAPTVEKAQQLQTELIQLMNKGGFQLRKWSSNHPALLASLSPELRECEVPLSLDRDDSLKTLGVHWQPGSDKFFFSVIDPAAADTKRQILSAIAKLFDPLGWLSPVTVKAKIFMQRLWKEECNWDELLPSELRKEWKRYQEQLTVVKSISIERCIIVPTMTYYELHGFADASEKAYAAAVYFRSVATNGAVKVSLVAAKTKVAPMKKISVPRLELCAAVLLANLMKVVQDAIQMSPTKIQAWSDSTVALAWIGSEPDRWKTYVANRVTEIQRLFPVSHWSHIRGLENPADCASRGLWPVELCQHPLWWKGPDWLSTLKLPSSTFTETDDKEQNEIQTEEKVSVSVFLAVPPDMSLLHRYSCLSKLVRVTAWVFRFITNCKLPVLQRQLGFLKAGDLNMALTVWIKKVQHMSFTSELRALKSGISVPTASNLLSLHPWLDKEEVLRVGGRLRHSRLEWDQRHPIVLPKNNVLTHLIIQAEHHRQFHAGPTLLLAILQRKYWILGARDLVRQFIRKCVICFRQKAEAAQQLMGDLPEARVNPCRAFLKTGVDYAGPFILKDRKGRGAKTYKGYLVLFVCFTTRALHLELASDMSTELFLAALKRFISTRGKCSDIFSDCGTNFVGAIGEMKTYISQLRAANQEDPEVAAYLASEGICWHLNPPGAPHFGGLWEAGVKSVKFHLKRVIGGTLLTYEEMLTVTKQIEACLNSRPLCPASNDPNDLTPLTPGHFLIGTPLVALPEPDVTSLPQNRLGRWQHMQFIIQHFWKRWQSEYLTRLQQRPKWKRPLPNLEVGDLVLVKGDHTPVMKWPLGRVINLHPGADGLARVVTLKTSSGELKRPITKVCPLPKDDGLESTEVETSTSTI